MADDSQHIDGGWDGLPAYADQSGDTDEAVTVSISTTPGEWLVNTNDAVVVPMSMAELVEGLRSRKLNEGSLVWRAGMQEWAHIDQVPQLKLAARLAPLPSTAPLRRTTKPPPKPVRTSTPAPPSASGQQLLSRKSTLPFGFANPAASSGSRPPTPPSAKPSQPPRAAAATPTPRRDDAEVLAVYARPAATISFDLSPEQPLRASAAQQPPPVPETLAPVTSESASPPRPPPRSADLSVVAASQFRQVQRSSKRVLWFSSLASAAAASLLTFWLSHRAPAAPGADAGQAASPAAAPAPAAAPHVAPPTPSALAVAPTPSGSAAPSVVAPSVVAAAVEPPAKPKAHRRRAVRPVTAPSAPVTEDAPAAPRDPSSEPNPYAAKLDDAAAADKPAAAAPAAPEPADKPDEPSASSTSP